MIKLKVSDKFQNKFNFTLDGKELAAAIDKILGVSAFGNATAIMRRHLFVSFNKKLYLVGYNANCCIAIDLKSKTDKNGSFNVEPDRLKGLVKSRRELDFSYTETELKMKKGTFVSSIKTSPVTSDQYSHINEYFGITADKSDALGSELLKKLRRGVQKTRLVDYTDNGQVSPVVVIFNKGILNIFTQNDYCGAFYETNIQESHDSFSMSVSNEVFNLVSKTLGDDEEESKADFYFMNDHFLISTNSIYICLPPLQDGEQDKLPRFKELLTQLEDESQVHSRQVLSTKQMVDTLSSVTVIAQDRGNMSLRVKDGKHTFESSSDEGSIRDTVKPIKLDPKKNGIKLKTGTLEVTTFAKTIHDLSVACGESEVQVSIHQVNGVKRPNILFLQTPSNYIPASSKSESKKKKKKAPSDYECLRQFSVLSSS